MSQELKKRTKKFALDVIGLCAGGVDAAQGYLAKADCDGPQFREISINLRLTQLLPRLYKNWCAVLPYTKLRSNLIKR